MKNKLLKRFINSEILITAVFILIIGYTFYVMRPVFRWKSIIVLILALFAYIVVGALNIVLHIRMKSNPKYRKDETNKS